MKTTSTREEERVDRTRLCSGCGIERRVVAKVGPFEVKEPCPNKCGAGYVKRIRSNDAN